MKGWFRILAKGLRMPQHLGQGGSERQQHAEILISSYLGLSERLMHLLIRHLWFLRGSVFWSSLILLFDPSDVQVKKEKCRLVCCLKRLATCQREALEKPGPSLYIGVLLVQKINVNLKIKCMNNRFHYSIIKES